MLKLSHLLVLLLHWVAVVVVAVQEVGAIVGFGRIALVLVGRVYLEASVLVPAEMVLGSVFEVCCFVIVLFARLCALVLLELPIPEPPKFPRLLSPNRPVSPLPKPKHRESPRRLVLPLLVHSGLSKHPPPNSHPN